MNGYMAIWSTRNSCSVPGWSNFKPWMIFSHPKICISKIFQADPRIFKIPRVPSRSDEVRREGLQDAPRSACVPGSCAGMRCGNLDTSDTASLCLGSRAHLAWLEPFSKIHIVIYYNYMIYIYIIYIYIIVIYYHISSNIDLIDARSCQIDVFVWFLRQILFQKRSFILISNSIID